MPRTFYIVKIKIPLNNRKECIIYKPGICANRVLGGRYVKNFDKVSIDISGETKVASELPYGNKDDEIYWIVGDTLYLNEDLYDPLEMRKNQIKTNIYYRMDRQNEFSIFHNYVGGSGYAMGSLGPIYNRGLKRHQYGFSFNNNSH